MGYSTKQSRLVLELLQKNANRHYTADDVFFTLHENGESIGKTTVYRQLEKLYDEGVIRKFLGGEGDSACFQLNADSTHCKEHYHLKCTKCGKLFHTECDFLDELSAHIYKEHSFTVDKEKFVLYGLCKDCAKNSKGGL